MAPYLVLQSAALAYVARISLLPRASRAFLLYAAAGIFWVLRMLMRRRPLSKASLT
ncbi:MAG TPA: hypothetical protein VLW45_04000 [Pelomicrobium sp.]|nr:hypothetical protein [Pelomicrobium sp.]